MTFMIRQHGKQHMPRMVRLKVIPVRVSLQFSTDGLNLFSVNKISYSMWPIMVTSLNFPKTCNNFENVLLLGIIPANNKENPKSVILYVEVLVDELLGLCETTFNDGFREEEFLF